MKREFWSFLAVALIVAGAPSVYGDDPGSKSKAKDAVEVESMDMFQAMAEGKVEINFIPKDATQATMVFENKTDKPIDLQVPRAFGAVHVLGQMGMGGMGGGMGGMGGMGGGMGGMGGGMGGMGGGGQGMGGGMGGMGGGGMGGMGGGMGGMGGGMGGMGGGMGGMFRVEPDKTRKIKVPCVCLEHGKKDPNPRMKYKLVPIEKINNDPRVAKLCEVLGSGRVPQNTIQAAAWHMANGLSWDQLAHKNRVESKYTGNVRFFNPMELQTAFRLSSLINREYDRYMATQEESTGYTEESTEAGS